MRTVGQVVGYWVRNMLKQNTSTRLIYLIVTFRPGTATPFGTFLPKITNKNIITKFCSKINAFSP